MKVKEESEKAGLKLNIEKTKIMASCPIILWQMENNGNSDTLYFLGLQNHCRWWLQSWNKRCLLHGRKAMTNLDRVLKSKDVTFSTKVHLVKVMVFPVAMYVCESWTIKKAKRWRIGAFELWYWRRLLRVPWTARRSNQSILKEINPEYSLEELMLKLKLQYFGHLVWRTDSLEKTLMQVMTEDEIVGCHHWLNGHEFEQALGVSDGQGSLACCSPCGHRELDMTERLNWFTHWLLCMCAC